jgi:hypothetical protein
MLWITNLPIYTQRKGQKLLAKVVRAYRVAKLLSLTLYFRVTQVPAYTYGLSKAFIF